MIKNILITGIIFLLINTPSYALVGSSFNIISKHAKSLPDLEIIKLSKMSDEVSGTRKVGRYLGEKNLPNEVLEDTYIRIALHQKKISREEAKEFYEHLRGVDGFRTTMSKVIGNSPHKTSGHLNELRIANNASRYGFKPIGIGIKYQDGLKKAATDIDIVLKKDNKLFIIEAKDYSDRTKLPMDKYRADLDTLNSYKKEHGDEKIIAIFSITNKPKNDRYLKLLKKEAKRRDIELLFGTPSQQIVQVNQLARVVK